MHLVKQFYAVLTAGFFSFGLNQALGKCPDIGVLSTDARYLVLDGDTLETRDVGNLWWLGIRNVDNVVHGSTLGGLGLYSDRVMDMATGSFRDDYWQTGGLFVLEDLGRQLYHTSKVPGLSDLPNSELQWIASPKDTRPLILRRQNGKSSVSLSDAQLKESPQGSTTLKTLRAACEDSPGRIFAGGVDHRLSIEQGVVSTDRLARAHRKSGYTMSGRSLNCLALMVKVAEEDVTMMHNAIIDLSTNSILSEYKTKRYVSPVLIANGGRLLQQVHAVPKERASRVERTDEYRLLDTRDGRVLRSTRLGIDGELQSHSFCSDEREYMVIKSPGRVHLLDPEKLEIVVSRDVPFERYFVF